MHCASPNDPATTFHWRGRSFAHGIMLVRLHGEDHVAGLDLLAKGINKRPRTQTCSR